MQLPSAFSPTSLATRRLRQARIVYHIPTTDRFAQQPWKSLNCSALQLELRLLDDQ